MFLTKLAIKRPVSTLLIFFSLLIFGISSIFGFKLAQMPSIEMPTFIVATPYPGADPELIDSTISAEIEEIGATIAGFTESRTISSEGLSMVVFSFDFDIDTNQTYMDIKTALDRLQLPEDALDSTIMEIALGQGAMMRMSVSGAEGEDILGFANDVLVPEIDALIGVAEVAIRGGEEEYISISADSAKMQQYGLSLSNIINSIAAYDYEIPLGEVANGDQSLNISASSQFTNLAELNNISIASQSGAMIKLSDIAKVEMAVKDADSISRNQGNSDIGVSITASNDANIPLLTAEIMDELAKIEQDYPDINIEITKNESENIISSLTSVATTLLIAVILCMIVLFVFLGNMKASFIIGSSIPLSLVITLIGMSLLNFELNLVTTTALIIAIGMMVDNSIVVLESIFKAQEHGNRFKEAAIEGFRLVGASVIASTITTIVVYLPMAFLGGMSGQLFSQLSLVIVMAMIASLISAMVLIPLFYYLIKPVEKPSPLAKILAYLEKKYDQIIRKFIFKRKTVLLSSIFLLLISCSLLLFIPIELISATDSGVIVVKAEFRPGTKIESIDRQILPIEQKMLEDTRLTNVITEIEGNSASIEAEITDNTPVTEMIDEYLLYSANFANTSITVEQSGSMMGSIGETSLGTTISGHDYDAVKAAASDLSDQIYQIPGILAVQSSAGSLGETKVSIKIDPDKALQFGLMPAQIAQTLRQSLSGTEVAVLNMDNDEYSVMLEYPQGQYDNLNSLMDIPIATSKGTIQLNQVAEPVFSDNAQTIERVNGIYTLELSAIVTDQNQESVQKAITELEENSNYGQGVEVGEGPGSNMTTDELTALAGAIGTAVFLVFIVMAVQFESIRFSLMVMTSIVFCFIGSFGLIFLTGQSLTMIGMMGLLMLVGIAVNNGILFVDTANSLKKDLPLTEALIASGKLRMRPILMTTATTILSMIPLALGIGEGTEMLQSMGIIIIGGLTTSTILVLFLMPTFYLLISKKEK